MERVTISSSLKFKEAIRFAVSELEKHGIRALFPNLESEIRKEGVDLKFMKKLEREHFEAIDGSEALYVICPDGYVGTLVSAEIGYAVAQGKPVLFSEEPEDLGLQAMASAYISLDELKRLRDFINQ
ncbi:MAG TPA: hypothetical protein VMW04_03825 [Patescibacteria group bacterium]|nr:hypothetical protein [Patescibacteria group bacterium]